MIELLNNPFTELPILIQIFALLLTGIGGIGIGIIVVYISN